MTPEPITDARLAELSRLTKAARDADDAHGTMFNAYEAAGRVENRWDQAVATKRDRTNDSLSAATDPQTVEALVAELPQLRARTTRLRRAWLASVEARCAAITGDAARLLKAKVELLAAAEALDSEDVDG